MTFLRAPRSNVVSNSKVFLNHLDFRLTASSLLRSEAPYSLDKLLVSEVCRLRFSKEDGKDWRWLVLKIALPYVNNLTNCSLAIYNRETAPRALKPHDRYRTDDDMLYEDIRDISELRRSIESLLNFHCCKPVQSHLQIERGQEIRRHLQALIDDLKDLKSFYESNSRSTENDYLGELIQSQVDRADEAKEVSSKLSRLSQLAYVFLPLQLSTSVLGMNLKEFGTGNIGMKTFVSVLVMIAILLFVPIIWPFVWSCLFEATWQTITRIQSIRGYSSRVALLYGWFCICHSKKLNNELWGSGIEHDLKFFEGKFFNRKLGESRWSRVHERIFNSLKQDVLSFFPKYWQEVLDEIFRIIDEPQ